MHDLMKCDLLNECIYTKYEWFSHKNPTLDFNSETHQHMYQPHPGDNLGRNPRTMGRRKLPTYDGNTSWQELSCSI